MKTNFKLLQKATIVALFFSFIMGQNLQAQNEPVTIYMEIAKVKKSTDDFKKMHDELVTPYIQERIKQGTMLAHAVFKVAFPNGDQLDYDYVMLDVFSEFSHIKMEDEEAGKIIYSAFTNPDIEKMMGRFEDAMDFMGSEVFVVRDEAFPGPVGGSDKMPKYVRVNHMDVSENNSSAYAKMESDIFKPIHQANAKAGNLHDWMMLQRIIPYGSDGDNDFLTFDIFSEWGDMAGGNFSALFKQVHPDKNMDDTWNKMSGLRDLRRSEIWELVKIIDTPTPEVKFDVVKEGTGPLPKKGQEVAFHGTLMNMDGETLFSSKDVLGHPFHYIMGNDPFDRFFDKALQQTKKGGIINVTAPVDFQDEFTRNMSGGKTAVMKLEVLDIAAPILNGAEEIKTIIESDGLAAAKKSYPVLQSEGYIFREGDMNGLGYQLMKDGHSHAALYIFELNQKNYPKSANACDSLGDGYRAAGNYAKAKHCYEMALKNNPDFKASKEKLEQM